MAWEQRFIMSANIYVLTVLKGDVVVISVERQTCDLQLVGSSPGCSLICFNPLKCHSVR